MWFLIVNLIFIHFPRDRSTVKVPASGLTIALDPVMQACGGTWIAHGSGDADREVVDQSQQGPGASCIQTIPLFSETGLAFQRG